MLEGAIGVVVPVCFISFGPLLHYYCWLRGHGVDNGLPRLVSFCCSWHLKAVTGGLRPPVLSSSKQ